MMLGNFRLWLIHKLNAVDYGVHRRTLFASLENERWHGEERAKKNMELRTYGLSQSLMEARAEIKALNRQLNYKLMKPLTKPQAKRLKEAISDAVAAEVAWACVNNVTNAVARKAAVKQLNEMVHNMTEHDPSTITRKTK